MNLLRICTMWNSRTIVLVAGVMYYIVSVTGHGRLAHPPARNNVWSTTVALVGCVLYCIAGARGHGRLIDPPARNSMWRFGYNTPVNYNDNELFCGGRTVQWTTNNGKCGICGDPYNGKREHEAGGTYANGIIVKSYTEGDILPITVHITANHLGTFEFRLCPNNNPKKAATQACLDQYLLELVDGGGGGSYNVPDSKYNDMFSYALKLPRGVTCTQCVLQWKYKTGNTWEKDAHSGKFCLGCGPQEEFYNCADIAIRPRHWGPMRASSTQTFIPSTLPESATTTKYLLNPYLTSKTAPERDTLIKTSDTIPIIKTTQSKSSPAWYTQRNPGWAHWTKENLMWWPPFWFRRQPKFNTPGPWSPHPEQKSPNQYQSTRPADQQRIAYSLDNESVQSISRSDPLIPTPSAISKTSKTRKMPFWRSAMKRLWWKPKTRYSSTKLQQQRKRTDQLRIKATKIPLYQSQTLAAVPPIQRQNTIGAQVTLRRPHNIATKVPLPWYIELNKTWKDWRSKSRKVNNDTTNLGHKSSIANPVKLQTGSLLIDRVTSPVPRHRAIDVISAQEPHQIHKATLVASKAPVSRYKSPYENPYKDGLWQNYASRDTGRYQPYRKYIRALHSQHPVYQVKVERTCRSIVPLMNGLNDWCYVNCNNGYCPSGFCYCEPDTNIRNRVYNIIPSHSLQDQISEQRWRDRYPYTQNVRPWYFRGNDMMAKSGPGSDIGFTRSIPFRSEIGNSNIWNTDNGFYKGYNENLNKPHPVQHQYSVSVRDSYKLRLVCFGIGRFAGKVQFDEWCFQNCQQAFCPVLLCSCTLH